MGYGSEWNSADTIKVVFLGGVILFGVMASCSSQGAAKNYGGSMDLNLPVNQKLVNITWKDSDLWYLTKPMTPADKAEIYNFQQRSNLGLWDGKIIIHEIIKTHKQLIEEKRARATKNALHGQKEPIYSPK